MAEVTITIIGLGKVGSSIGLALNKPDHDYRVIGHDKNPGITKRAKALGAVGSTSWNLINACEPADVVVLAIPFDQIQETLEVIGPELKSGAVVIDTSPFKGAVIEWASEHLREGAHFVGIWLGTNPQAIVNLTSGPDGAQADLFAHSPCCVVPSPTCQPEAVKAAQDLATLLGATPYFMDPLEYDGLSTAVNTMPTLVVNALLGPVMDSPGWREMRRLASTDLFYFSQPLMVGGPGLAQAVILNKTNVLRWLDETVAELERIREEIDNGAEDALSYRVDAADKARERWLADWERDLWERPPQTEMPSGGGWFGSLFGVRLRRKPEDEQ